MFILPYRERVIQDDGEGAYAEEFVPGCFRDQVTEAPTRPLRVWLDIEHNMNMVIGHATRLQELDGGLYGSFAVHTCATGDLVLASVRDGLTAVSATVTPLRTRTVDGTRRRIEARLVSVALVRNPAYADAKVFRIRRARRDDQPGPASADEFDQWERERLDGKLLAVACQRIDENPRSYKRDGRFQAALRLRAGLAEERRQLEPQTIRRWCR